MIMSDFEQELDGNYKDARLGVVGVRGCWKNSGKFPEGYAPPGGTQGVARR